jgi:hypothetical protein
MENNKEIEKKTSVIKNKIIDLEIDLLKRE